MIFEDGTRRVYPLEASRAATPPAAGGGQLTPAPASPIQGHLTLGVIGSSEVRRGSWVEVKPSGMTSGGSGRSCLKLAWEFP